MKYRKMLVDMYAKHRRDGKVIPIKFHLEDGTAVKIDRFLHAERAASPKVGGCGMRYTVMIEGAERQVFEDDGIWYIEAEIV